MKWLKILGVIIPILASISSGLFWIDTRYMHKEISDFRYLELQITVYENIVKSYHRKIDNENYKPSEEEKREYEIYLDILKKLNIRRNEIIGAEL